jgi:hypothetical protein
MKNIQVFIHIKNYARKLSVVFLLTYICSCNKGLVYLHNTEYIKHSFIYNEPIICYNGVGGKEVLISYRNVRNIDSLTIQPRLSDEYKLLSFDLYLYIFPVGKLEVQKYSAGENRIPEYVMQMIQSGKTTKFILNNFIIKDKWGHVVKPLYREMTFYVLDY